MTKPGRMILFIFTIMLVLAACSDSQAADFAVGSLPDEAETGSPFVPEDTGAVRGAVVADVCNPREAPSTNSRIIKRLTPDDVFTIIDAGEDWYQAQLDDGTVGWIAAYLVKIQKAVPETIITVSGKPDPEEARNETDRHSSPDGEIQAIPPYPKALSETVYPEYILLSENFWTATEIYSPIDHAYNQNRAQADFIDSFAGEYEIIWRRELEYQYNKCIQNMPEEYKEKFALQQLAWEEYFDNDVFPEIAQIYDEEDNNIGGYGFSREATLIRLDRVRTRTIEIMRIQTHIDGLNVAFSMENTFYPDLDHINGLFSLGDWQALFYDELSKYIDSPKAMFNICDLDGDGTPELLLSKDDYHAASGEIYTIDQGTLKHLGDYGGWGEFQYDFERNYIHSSFMAQGSTQLSIYQLENGAAVEVISFFDPYYLSMSEGEPEINGERVSPATYRAEYEKYDFASRDDFCVRKYDINESEIVRVLNFW